MSSEIIAEIKKDYMYNLIKKGERVDGRAFNDYRKIVIETGTIRKAEGSARVWLGDTQVQVGVKMQPGEPYPDTPDTGVIITSVELVPMASPSFEPGPPREDSIEIARVVDRGVRESGAIDLEKLLIAEDKVWMLFIDIHVLDHDGNLVDAASLGAIAALLTAKVPNKRYELGEDAALPIRDIPIAVTAADFEGQILLDPELDEERIASTKLTVISGKDGSIAGMQKSGIGTPTQEKIEEMVDIAIKKAKEIRETHFAEFLK
jgi:exosome complex component RRP42